MKPSTTFTVSRTEDAVPDFAIHEHCCFRYGKIDGVRACLSEHLLALRQRVEALQSVLSTDDPERAERLLLDPLSVAVTEVTLRPRTEKTAFDTLMKKAFRSAP